MWGHLYVAYLDQTYKPFERGRFFLSTINFEWPCSTKSNHTLASHIYLITYAR